MPVVTIQDVGQHDGQEVTLRGWLYNLREAGKLLFPIFRDGTGTIQGVVSQKRRLLSAAHCVRPHILRAFVITSETVTRKSQGRPHTGHQ